MLSRLPPEEIATIVRDDVRLHACISHALPGAHYVDIGAIILHPYGPLGGDLDNNVVRELTAMLAGMGMSTLRFNMRGVPPSTGSTSWTSSSEVDDLRAIVEYWLDGSSFADTLFVSPEDGRSWPKVTPKKIIICGYSYGSMIALPVINHSPAIIAAILISPPTRYIGLLSLFQSSSFYTKLPMQLPKLFITGDSDSFTSVSGVRSFIQQLCGQPTSFTTGTSSTTQDICADVMIIPGYDHFWLGHEDQVTERVKRWLNNILQYTDNTITGVIGN